MSYFEKNFDRTNLNSLMKWAYNPTMLAIRNGFLLSLPLIAVGCVAILLNNMPITVYQEGMTNLFGPRWKDFGGQVWKGTFGVLSLPMLYGISYHLVTVHNYKRLLSPVNPIIVSLVAFSSLIAVTPTIDGDWLPPAWMGASGLFVSILVAITATHIFLRLIDIPRLQLIIYAEGGEASIFQAFTSLIPAAITISIFAAIHILFRFGFDTSLHESVKYLVLFPFKLIQDGLGTGVAYVFVCHLFWFFGIHGPNVLDPVTHEFYEAAMNSNNLAQMQGLPIPHIITKPFLDVFIHLGGAGSSICLLVALFIKSKNKGNRRLAQVSLVPSLFNINELLLFGLPVILNPIFLIPFLCVPLILMMISYLAVTSGWVPTPMIPDNWNWTTPPIIGGYMATGSIRGSILQCINICIGAIIYLPFVQIADRLREERQKKAMNGLLEVSCNNVVGPSGKKCLDRNDEIGALARTLANDLQRSLNENTNLYLEYQPQVNYLTGEVVGAEALVRWRHDIFGLIPAPIIVAISEDGDFIKPLGFWVLNEACAERKRCYEMGFGDHFEISVNISVLQLEDTDLAQKIADCLQRHQLEPQMIGVEITESAALDPDAPHNKILYEINKLGICMSIDDFGMGHSSLIYLKHFPVDTLKIDKALSKDVATDNTCLEIIATVAELCHTLRINVVVEYVENQEQIEVLLKLGCHLFQGYFFSRPLSGEKMRTYVTTTNKKASILASAERTAT